MPNYNKVIMIGHIVRDPEMKTTSNGTPVANTALAVSEKYKDKETTCFIDFEAWGKLAELLVKYVHKGDPLQVEGKLKQDNWEDKATGAKRSKHKITVTSLTLLGSKKATTGEQPTGGLTDEDMASPQYGGEKNPFDEDMPF